MTLVSILKEHCKQKPNQIVYTFLEADNVTTLTFAELDQKASSVAANLLKQGAHKSDRIIIALPQGLNYLTAFWGCLYAGLIAVPVLHSINPNHIQRTATITQDTQAKFILANSKTIAAFANIQNKAGSKILTEMNYVDIETISNNESTILLELPKPEDIAFLQYTSGSTSQPKGVIVKHKNLTANLHLLTIAIEVNVNSRLVSWLPLFHDLGLIGKALLVVFAGAQLFLMSPLNFIKNPLVWLETISKYQGTHSYAPNFAYDLCIAESHQLSERQLNLASLQYLVNAAEPIRADTLTRFNEIFKEYGFNPNAWTPGYGMAEATLFITCRASKQSDVSIDTIDTDSLSLGQAVLASKDSLKTKKIVNLGKFQINQELIIVNPETLCTQATRNIGEIWVKGAHICEGYWNLPKLSNETFFTYTKDSENGPWLRTGDLGYLDENGDLFIVSRYKDLIIIHGKNYAPQDFEETVIECSELIKYNSVIAFSLDEQEEEKLIIVIQLHKVITIAQNNELVKNIKKRLLTTHGITAHNIVFVTRHGIPLTTSGKLQRRRCKQQYLSGTLPLLPLADET